MGKRGGEGGGGKRGLGKREGEGEGNRVLGKRGGEGEGRSVGD